MTNKSLDSSDLRVFDIAHEINDNAARHCYNLNIGSELACVLKWLIVLIGILYLFRYIKEWFISCKKENNRKRELGNAKSLADTRICHQTILDLSKTANSEQIQSELKNIKERLDNLENPKK